jgi:hypothetical protein
MTHTPGPCTCQINDLTLCVLHDAAPGLLDALRDAAYQLCPPRRHNAAKGITGRRIHEAVCKAHHAHAAIAKAKGE